MPITRQSLERLQDELETLGVRTINPTGGYAFGTLDLVNPRGHCIHLSTEGQVALYDIREGTPNQRILTTVSEVKFAKREWPKIAAVAISEHQKQPIAKTCPLLTIPNNTEAIPGKTQVTLVLLRTILLEDWGRDNLPLKLIAKRHNLDGAIVSRVILGFQHNEAHRRTHGTNIELMFQRDKKSGVSIDPIRIEALRIRETLGHPETGHTIALRERLGEHKEEWVPAMSIPGLFVTRTGRGRWENGSPAVTAVGRPTRWRSGSRHGDISRPRIILLTFVGPPPDGIDHGYDFLDKNGENCHVNNLCWNQAPKSKNSKKLTSEQILLILRLCGEGVSQVDSTRQVGVMQHTSVRRVIEGQISRGNGKFSPYHPKYDPQRREMLQQRDTLLLKDNSSTAALRARLGM